MHFQLKEGSALLIPTLFKVQLYCEQEHAVGYILKYGEEDGMLGEILQRGPLQVVGDKGNTAWKNWSLGRGRKDEKSELDREGRDRLCTVLSPLGN